MENIRDVIAQKHEYADWAQIEMTDKERWEKDEIKVMILEDCVDELQKELNKRPVANWILPKDEMPVENRKVIFKVGENDIRMGSFLVKDQWDRPNMFCDGSFHKAENVEGWFYVPNCA